MSFRPKFKRTGRGLVCCNMDEGVMEANEKGFTDSDIVNITHVDLSTVRSWLKTKHGLKKSAIILERYLNRNESKESIDDQSTTQKNDEEEKNEKIAEIERLFEYMDQRDINLNEILKEGILKRMKPE